MLLFVGLGNPGKEYEGTRHNMGFVTLDKFAELVRADFDRSGFKGSYGIVRDPEVGGPLMILKPETFMNNSGESVQALSSYFKIGPDEIVVVHDDMALPEGSIRIKPDGSSGGQKGMQSIIDLLGTEKIARIRIGIGEPPHKDAVNYVLGKPKGESLDKLDEATSRAAKALLDIATRGLPHAMSVFNAKEKAD